MLCHSLCARLSSRNCEFYYFLFVNEVDFTSVITYRVYIINRITLGWLPIWNFSSRFQLAIDCSARLVFELNTRREINFQIYPRPWNNPYLLKGQCHEDFAVLDQFWAKIITLRLYSLTKCFYKATTKILNEFYQRGLTIIKFLRIFLKT